MEPGDTKCANCFPYPDKFDVNWLGEFQHPSFFKSGLAQRTGIAALDKIPYCSGVGASIPLIQLLGPQGGTLFQQAALGNVASQTSCCICPKTKAENEYFIAGVIVIDQPFVSESYVPT